MTDSDHTPNFKICTTCLIEKPLDEFRRKAAGRPGRQARCKSCDKDYRRQYYEANKERTAEQQRDYRENNKEKKSAYDRRFRAEHREELVERSRQYYQDNKEQISVQQR
jgi:hypothetical protein